ncbi:MAG: gliding motility protein GldM, partial [Cytophagaceae bacterium]|nr:gliding motility protein GldM [Cytophagaceae bacterium]
MASNKETPRQRMIGMMYLVLTALLALQVSSAMIYKFQSLNESLELTTKETGARNNFKLNAILSEVEKRKRSNEKHLAVTAKEVSTKSAEMIEYIEKIKKELITESGGYDEDGNLKGAKEETKVEVLMIGANNSGKAYEMKNKLDQYVKFMSDKTGVKFSPLALDGKDDPLFQNNEDQKNKDFAHLNFGQTPLVAGLAILSEIQSRISTMQATTLTGIGDKIALDDYKVDKMIPMARPSSKVVAAGTKYEAQLFMAATSSSQKPAMYLGENPIEVDPTGVGKFSFTASGGPYDAHGNVKKTWTGKIKVTKPDGTDTIYTHTEEYTVTKPVIQVQAAAVQALYRNCGNKLNIQVPALGNAYNPRITAEGANVITGTNKGFVTVVPTGASVSLKVNSDGYYIGEE